MRNCPICQAKILAVRMESGRQITVDKTPHPDGQIAAILDRETGNLIGWYVDQGAGKAPTYKSHASTCPGEPLRLQGGK